MFSKITYLADANKNISQTMLKPKTFTVEQNAMIQQRNRLYMQQLHERNSSFWNFISR